jgi:hypothetical protein
MCALIVTACACTYHQLIKCLHLLACTENWALVRMFLRVSTAGHVPAYVSANQGLHVNQEVQTRIEG